MNYFGDDMPEPCGNCDNCLSPAKTWDGTDAARKALSCVYRTDQRFGVVHLISVLRGKLTDKITQFNHQNVSTFGIGSDLSESQWRSVFRQLVARGYLSVNFDYGQVYLADKCRALLRGDETIELRLDTSTGKQKSGSSGKAKSAPVRDEDFALWEALRACRKRLADDQGVPPFVIFHDATLKEMIENKPNSLPAFSTLSGVGQKKLDKYGSEFLLVLADY